MRKWLLLALLLACGDDDAGLDLDERRFTLQSGRDAVTGTTPTLTFDEGELGFYAGCNAKSGPFAIRGGKLVIDEMTSDLAACDDARGQQDEWFAAFLLADPKISLDGTTLTLTGDVTLVFGEQP